MSGKTQSACVVPRLAAVCAAALALWGPAPVSAQGMALQPPRLRATAHLESGLEVRYVGEFASLEGDTLTLFEHGTHQVLPVDAIHRLEASRGRRGHGRLGALIGAGVGVAFGFAAVGADDGQGSTGAGIVVVPLSAALYGGVGALIGSFIRTERWVDIPIERLRRL